MRLVRIPLQSDFVKQELRVAVSEGGPGQAWRRGRDA